MAEGFVVLLSRSFEVLERESPQHLARLQALLQDRTVHIGVGPEVARVAARADRPVTCAGAGTSANVSVRLSRRAFDELLDGGLETIDAVLDGRLEVVGSLGDLAVFHDALQAYVHGAIRSPGFPPLMAHWRAQE